MATSYIKTPAQTKTSFNLGFSLETNPNNYNYLISFNNLHYINQRATPDQITFYKHALLHHQLYNPENACNDWVELFFRQHFNERDQVIIFFNTSNYKIGSNLLTNRFTVLNGKIKLSWLNDPYDTYKIKCKNEFLKPL